MRKLASVFLILSLVLSLCACGSGDALPTTTTPDNTLPEQLVGCWYPHPEVRDGCIEFRSDGTCSYYGEETQYTIQSRTEDTLLLQIGIYHLTFFQINSILPALSDEQAGECIRYPELWSLVGEWYNPDTAAFFVLELNQLPDLGCNLEIGEDHLDLYLLENDEVTYEVHFYYEDGTPAADVICPDGRVLRYFNAESGPIPSGCNHSYTLTDSLAATCTEPGSETYTCQLCGKTKTNPLAAIGHAYENRVCTHCGIAKEPGELVFTLDETGNGYSVIGLGTWDDPLLTIPESYNGLPVTTIGENAFSGCDFLTAVELPDSLIYINERAFFECTGIKTIRVPDSVIFIGWEAFYGCSGLESIQLSKNLTTLGGGVLSLCSALKECTVPDGVTTLPGSTFYGCTSLTSVTLPDNLKFIDEYAFVECTSLKQIRLPDSLEGIGAMAFHRCQSLEQITLPSDVTVLEKWVFADCPSLSITIPATVVNVGPGAVSSCKKIQVGRGQTRYRVSDNCLISSDGVLVSAGLNFTIPTNGSVTAIGDYAFFANPCTEVVIPDSVTTLGEAVFSGCRELKHVALPKGITAIPKFFFVSTGIEHFTIPNTVTSIGYGAFQSCEQLKTITIPEGVTDIGPAVFAGCAKLDHVVIPEGVTILLSGLFQGCTSLTDVTIPSTVTEMSSAFHGCTALKSITLPENLNKMYGSFYDCSALQSITIPESVTHIGDNVFRGCDSLTSVVVPNSVTSMGMAVFMHCENLKQVTLPAGLQAVTELTFSWCVALESVTIPASVTTISSHAFVMCNALKTVYFGGSADQWAQIQIGEYNEPLANAQIECN